VLTKVKKMLFEKAAEGDSAAMASISAMAERLMAKRGTAAILGTRPHFLDALDEFLPGTIAWGNVSGFDLFVSLGGNADTEAAGEQACLRPGTEWLRRLREAGAGLRTAPASVRFPEQVDFLVEHGVSLDYTGPQGSSVDNALRRVLGADWAVAVSVVERLCLKCGDPLSAAQRASEGLHRLHLVMDKERMPAVIAVLLNAGGSLAALNDLNLTPLGTMMFKSQWKTCICLIEAGADLFAVHPNGRSLASTIFLSSFGADSRKEDLQRLRALVSERLERVGAV
jgi:hypothetical protein